MTTFSFWLISSDLWICLKYTNWYELSSKRHNFVQLSIYYGVQYHDGVHCQSNYDISFYVEVAPLT